MQEACINIRNQSRRMKCTFGVCLNYCVPLLEGSPNLRDDVRQKCRLQARFIIDKVMIGCGERIVGADCIYNILRNQDGVPWTVPSICVHMYVLCMKEIVAIHDRCCTHTV